MTDTQTKPKDAEPAKFEEKAMTKAEAEESTLAQMKIVGNVTLLDAAKAFAGSGFFKDVKSQSQAITKILMGHELGVSPVRSMLGIHAIEIGGVVRLEPGYELRAQLIKQHPRYDYRVRESDWNHCKIEWFELDPNGERFESSGFSEFSIENANKLNVGGKGVWKQDPESMCFAAALRRGCRKYAPDVTFGADLDVDDAQAVHIAAEHEELPSGDEPVEAELVEEEGPDAREERPTPAAASPDDGPSSSELTPEEDAAPPTASASPSGEGAASGDVVHIGRLAVPRAGDGPWLATEGKYLRSKDQCIEAQKLVSQLDLVENALAPICEARYGIALGQASKVALDELIVWLQAQVGIVKAFTGNEPPLDEEPPL